MRGHGNFTFRKK